MPAPHIERMMNELAELTDRAEKLDAFTGATLFSTLDKIDQDLLFAQSEAMKTYGSILSIRLQRTA